MLLCRRGETADTVGLKLTGLNPVLVRIQPLVLTRPIGQSVWLLRDPVARSPVPSLQARWVWETRCLEGRNVGVLIRLENGDDGNSVVEVRALCLPPYVSLV